MGATAVGQHASFVAPLDVPHDFAYVPDIHRAVTSIVDAPGDAFGQAWHMPCAPTETVRAITMRALRAFGGPLNTNVAPLWSLPILGIFIPLRKEMAEMRSPWTDRSVSIHHASTIGSGKMPHPSIKEHARRSRPPHRLHADGR